VSLAAISLAALVLALALSCTTTINIGFLAIVLAWIVGSLVGGMPLNEVLSGFPTSLFLTLAGLTLLFSQAQVNGTLDRVTYRAVRGAAGAPGVIPFIFFGLTWLLASIGPGHIAATALMAPLAMAAAGRYAISPFLMAIMVANGASAGSLSPISPTGVVVNDINMKMGLGDVRWPVYLNTFIAHTVIAWAGYLLLGGWTLLRHGSRTAQARGVEAGAAVPALAEAGVVRQADAGALRAGAEAAIAGPLAQPGTRPSAAARKEVVVGSEPFEWRHWLTCAVIAALVLGVIVLNLDPGLTAIAGAVILTLGRAADEKAAIKVMPWGVIMMVCGVTLLVTLLQRTGGMALFADFLGQLATPATSTAVAAFFSGVISLYSSTIGVVLPALLPTVPDLIKNIGGGDALALVSSMIIGGHLVDVSPLSTLGALCLAAAPAGTDTRALFNKLLAWGVSMTVVAAAVCWVFFA
jgi:di/tricarboxylate transporter